MNDESKQLSKIVISLEFAKALKDLGVPQESAFYWHVSTFGGYTELSSKRNQHPLQPYSAFTSAEICQMLFKHTGKIHQVLDKKNIYIVKAPSIRVMGNDKLEALEFEDETQQDACVRLLIYLINRRLIKAK